ncbi:MAG: TRAP transporter large permease [Betaproteobacteria bacterium]|nr:TRAP transporter large permease [Betaproteobacteria bacterium]
MLAVEISFVALLVLLASGAPIFIAVGAAAVAGLLTAGVPFDTAAQVFVSSLGGNALLAIPLFVLMAEIMTTGGMIARLVNLLHALVGHWQGGLGYVAVFASAIFAAFSGSSPANAAALGIALIPQMLSAGYSPRFTAGVIAAGGTLGILIPPSINMILYSAVTDLPVLDLFRAGVKPGLILAGAFLLVVALWNRMAPLPVSPPPDRAVRLQQLRAGGPVLLLPIIVLGAIYSAVLTVTESAIAGIVYAVFLQLGWYRDFKWSQLYVALACTVKTTSMIYLIIGTASLFAHLLTLSQIPQHMAGQIAPLIQFSPVAFYAAAMLLLIILGMFIDVAAITYIAVPVLDHALRQHGLDRVQFAMMFVINMEMGLITPPFGLNTFIVAAAAKLPIGEVVRGAAPFVAAMVAVIIIVGMFPGLSH